MVKFKVYRLSDINQIEPKLNDFDLGIILHVKIAAPDYRIVILVIQYDTDEAKDDKASK